MKSKKNSSKQKGRTRLKRPLSSLQAQIRADPSSSKLVAKTAKQSSLRNLIDLLEWYIPRYRIKDNLVSLRPKRPSQLPEYVQSADGSLGEQIRWTVAATKLHIVEILQHNKNLNFTNTKIEDYSSSLDQSLSEIENEMWSFSAISQLLFAFAAVKGLETQRAWLTSNGYVSTPSISNLILYSKAIACEVDRHPTDILEILNISLYNNLRNEKLNLFLYAITFSPILHKMVYEQLVQMYAYFPVVDQYEALINVATSSIDVDAQSILSVHPEILELMEQAGDWRFKPAQRLVGNPQRGEISLPIIPPSASSFLNSIGIVDAPATAADRTYDIALANEFLFQPQSPRGYLASAFYGIKTAETLEEVQAAITRRKLAAIHFGCSAASPHPAIKLTFDSLSTHLGRSDSAFEQREIFLISSLCGIEEGRLHEVLLMLYDFTNNDPLGTSYFPSARLLPLLTEDTVSHLGEDPRVAVALARVAVHLGEEGENLVYLAVEQFLTSRGLLKPSELAANDSSIIDFLYEACTTSSLRQSLEFTSKEEMEEERIHILFNLEQANPEREDEYLSEVHDIIGQQTIDELLKRFHIGKVQCDEEALSKWAAADLLPKFNRLNDFIEAGLLPVEKNADTEFLAYLTSGSAEKFTFVIPSNESLDIAKNILSELIQKYAVDPRYGVDSYLSLGMRHGAVAEHLRSPLLAENILTPKGLTEYPEDCFWKDYYLQDGSDAYGNAIGAILAKFSEAFDEKLEQVKEDLLHVRRPDKPLGLVVCDWAESTVLSLSSRFATASTISDFLPEFSAVFWANLDNNLVESRRYIEVELSKQLNDLIDNMEEEVRLATGRPRLSPFSDALMRARQELANSIKDVSSWHNVARSTDVEPLGLVDIISAAQKIVTRLYPEFQPKVHFSGDTQVSLTYSLHILIEVFKALFTNVYDHSGWKSPTIEVTITVIGQNALGVDFTSDCVDVDKAEQAALDNNEKIRTGEYEKKLPKEGGSGLAKVARSTVREGKPNTIVTVDRERSRFGVSMIFNLVNY
ncbi:hypothetical protein JHL21_06260 [Devosia sp. WQ 349]|uniref:hypothetical protein n=1 Tax=Devosia sp. WQ 349K1 TaxID=2800329 RepID=UPI00190649A1|nr:hypothetical protein [Devosia sp. WQ 349K1]MBK1794100.1 hypothetical protein [Devosia sp. WQ 349K1]